MPRRSTAPLVLAALIAGAGLAAPCAIASTTTQAEPDKAEYPPFEKVSEGLTEVVSVTDGSAPFYELWEDRDTGRMLAVLPRGYEGKTIMIAATVSGGDPEAGVMGPTFYAEWRQIGKQLALVEPNLFVRTSGDKQAKDSMEQLYTGRVLLSTPIVAMKSGRPVIDIGSIATQQSAKIFGASPFGGYGPSGNAIDHTLSRITKTKAFPENVILEYEGPRRADGRLVRLTYNISSLEGTKGYQPRPADNRVGFFYDYHLDYAKPANAEITDRYINRWSLEKADPKLKLSPPKQPIVWYIEHTTPIEYRRYVREGILLWNEAFEEIGILGAVEVYQQDSNTGAHMEKDPEDARYNFFRWNASEQTYAIGPSRTNPYTGEILDADVVWHQGLTRSVRGMLENFVDEHTEEAFGPETLAFFAEHPEWDPRVRSAPPESRALKTRRLALEHEHAVHEQLGTPEHPYTRFSSSHDSAACRIGTMLSTEFGLADAAFATGLLTLGDDEQMLDGIPESYIGPMIRYISAHEVGHCLGLQHNMAASSIRSLEEINSEGYSGATVGSVMDYVAANINHEMGEVQGPYATEAVGPYDKWAIQYGYGFEKDLEKVLDRNTEPDLIFLSQSAIGTSGDPRNATWDMGADNLQYARSRLALVQDLRARLVSDIVDDGESWAIARRRFNSLMNQHYQSLGIAAGWVGGYYMSNAEKGDPDATPPITDIPADRQREALAFVLAGAFDDASYGITPELVRHLGKEHFWDQQAIGELSEDASLPLHDLVDGVQSYGLSLLMNPTRLRRIYDNEFRAENGDTLSAHEVLTAVTDHVWDGQAPSGFRRNLQREHVERLITLMMLGNNASPTMRTISTLATAELKRVQGKAESMTGDAYAKAHAADINTRIDRALKAQYVIGG
ncbi:MAG: zinc-dependent metalloprotease [Phycisphaerales bacterium JB040]